MTGTNNVIEAIQLYTNSKSIFNEASMNLREWVSNSNELNSFIPIPDRAVGNINKVLGLLWNVERDTLSLKSVPTGEIQEITKRSILKTVASVFDPLGLFSPIVLRGKLLLQSLWGKSMDWDDPIEEEDAALWPKIEADLQVIPNKSVPRKEGLNQNNTDAVSMRYQLHCF